LTTIDPKNNIPIHILDMAYKANEKEYSEEIFHGVIDGLSIFHKIYTTAGSYPLSSSPESAVFWIVLQGNGTICSELSRQFLDKDSLIVLPTNAQSMQLELLERQSLHILEFRKAYSEVDKAEVSPSREFYYARFEDCEPYTEKIKSPNTISRTVLHNGIIPRVALGTVEAMGPDRVGEHSHPMLEQLFLGLANNQITVFADEARCEMGEYSLLHIPLGSTHWVEVAEGSNMNYMWMDFFLTKAGEVWLKTHKPISEKAISDSSTSSTD